MVWVLLLLVWDQPSLRVEFGRVKGRALHRLEPLLVLGPLLSFEGHSSVVRSLLHDARSADLPSINAHRRRFYRETSWLLLDGLGKVLRC